MSAKNILESMLKDIKAHDIEETKCLRYYVDLRLNKSVETYYKELLGSKNFLGSFNELSVAKKLLKTL